MMSSIRTKHAFNLINAKKLFFRNKINQSCYFESKSRYLNTNCLPIEVSQNLNDDSYDLLVVIGSGDLEKDDLGQLNDHINELKMFKESNKAFDKELSFFISNKKRLIYSPTGPFNRDYDDVRSVMNASRAAIKKAVAIGSKKPLLFNTLSKYFKYSDKVALLGALEASYNPLEIREAKSLTNLIKLDKLGYFNSNSGEANLLVKVVNAMEMGRIVARDIGGSDPERMCPQNVLTYVNDALASIDIKITVIEGQENFENEYPSFAAVNRAANVVPRHRGKIVKLEYNPNNTNDSNDSIDTTLFLVGKGLTYDTGGADIKYGGSMPSMHRDKCGAAFVAGFFKSLSILRPKGLKVHGVLCLTRNSVGEECYVADEIITARSKKRIRIGNTDAEGRMAICDLLNEYKDLALKEKNPQLFTIATLTGHALQTYGTNYSAIMSNGPALSAKIDQSLQESGSLIADPYEISRIRKEDYENHTSKTDEYVDLTQIQNKPTMKSRGHQGPAAFLAMASGLDKHGNDSTHPLPYTHVDIAGPSINFPGTPSAAPLVSFLVQYVLPKI